MPRIIIILVYWLFLVQDHLRLLCRSAENNQQKTVKKIYIYTLHTVMLRNVIWPSLCKLIPVLWSIVWPFTGDMSCSLSSPVGRPFFGPLCDLLIVPWPTLCPLASYISYVLVKVTSRDETSCKYVSTFQSTWVALY